MDSKLFVLPTNPNFYSKPSPAVSKQTAFSRTFPDGQYYVGPAPDSRFPGWSGPMEDGRLATDWRPHCNRNVPAGLQFGTTQWMQRNADQIITVSRERQSMDAGANLGFDNTIVAPPKNIVSCDIMKCGYSQTGLPYGIGTERQEPVPELFGTFNTDVPEVTQRLPPITSSFEGGRNSLRGRHFTNLGNGGVGSVNIKGTYLRAN
jgi:hypothetical protein